MSVGEAHAPVVLFIGLVAVDGVPDGTVVVVTEVEGPEYNVPFVEVVIDSGQVLVLGVFAPAEEPQIQKWIIVVGSVLRPDVHQRLADRVNQGLRQYAARRPALLRGPHKARLPPGLSPPRRKQIRPGGELINQ